MRTITELKKEFAERARDNGLRIQCPSDGSFEAEIAIIGEGPGQREVNAEQPFVGESGRLLWNALRPHGILRTHCFITNVCKRQISLHANSRYPVAADEWIRWKHLLQWELDQLPNLKYILCMGNAGLSALFGEDKITNHRGSVRPYKSCSTVLTYNPAAVLREPKQEIVFLMDIRRFKTVVQGDYKQHEINKLINPSFSEACDYIDKLREEEPPVAFDIEVISGETACFGIGNSANEAMCINLRQRYENTYSIEQEAVILRKMQELFDQKKIIAQNGNFDAHWCGYKDLLDVKIHFDTMLAHHTLYPLLPHSLAFLTSQYTTHPFYKDDGENWKEGGDLDMFWRYNATDVAITFACYEKLRVELEDQGLADFFHNHVMRLDPHLVRSTCDGFLVDRVLKERIAYEMKDEVEKIAEKFINKARSILDNPYYSPNINSNPQMKELFFQRLKLKSTTGSVAAPERAKLIDDVRTPLDIKDLLILYNEYQREKKFYSTYAESRVDDDDRWRMVWKQQGVTKAPGRLSSSGNLWNTASNTQNQPTRAHGFFVADRGTVMFYVDGSQAEARVVAYLADIEKWKHDFERARLEPGSFDAHCALASDMYKIPYENVPKEDWVIDPSTGLEIPTIRYKAKRSRHGLNYRMNYPRLAETTGLSMFEAKKTYILYHNTTPEIKAWWAELERIAKKERQLFTPLGRRLRIIQRIDDDALESIVAFVPQSTIGDLVKRVWYKTHEDDEWDNSKMRIKLNIHDALIGIAHPDYAKKALSILTKHFEEPILIEDVYKKKVEPLIIPADGKIAPFDEHGWSRWSNLAKVKL